MTPILFILLVFIIVLVVKNIRIVNQSEAYVIERLGSYSTTWSNGLHIKVPFIDRVVKKATLKEQVADFPPQPVITKDNVTMEIDTVVFFQITDPKLYTYGVVNPINAIENLTATTLRNIIGSMDLDQSLTSRDEINGRMRSILDEATDPWGIKVNRVELRNIIPPRQIQEAMEKQMRAERERREAILQAEGQKQSQILISEGEKQALILAAEAKKESMLLEADAIREATIRKADGEAQAILKIQEATAAGLEKIKTVKADSALIQLKSLETLEKMADGKSTKIVIPSELQGFAGGLLALKETISDNETANRKQ